MSLTLGTVDNPQGLWGLPKMAANRAVRDNAGFYEESLSRKSALGFYGIASTDHPDLAQFVRETVAPVLDELQILRHARQEDPVGYAKRIVVFGILSSQLNFAENLLVTQQILPRLDDLPRMLSEEVKPLFTVPYHGTGALRAVNGWVTKLQYLIDALPFLRRLTAANATDLMTLENIGALRGVGPKIQRFVMALWDPWAPVFTLDTWMLRLTGLLTGHPANTNYRLTDRAYDLIEGDWLAWWHRNLPELPPFAVQWALWNGAFGYHRSHLAIIQEGETRGN